LCSQIGYDLAPQVEGLGLAGTCFHHGNEEIGYRDWDDYTDGETETPHY
jgi:hypothetical protein